MIPSKQFSFKNIAHERDHNVYDDIVYLLIRTS